MIEANCKQTGHVTLTSDFTTITGYIIIALDTFYLHTKFGDSRFSSSGYIIAGIKIVNGSCDPDHAPFRGGLSFVC